MFSLTPAAADQIAQAAQASGAAHLALRIAAKAEQDGSLQYGMGFDDPRENDLNLELEGVAVVISEQHHPLLEHIVLDFVELAPGEFNFIFIPPSEGNAEAEAKVTVSGCGSGGCGSCGGGKS
jgi:iron-sulfur cluster assembly protein